MAEHTLAKFIGSFAICLVVGYINLYLFTTSVPVWYGNLQVPAFVPPATFLFYAIILVFILLGFSLFYILTGNTNTHDVIMSFYLFLFGLVLNVLWFLIFFGLRSVFMALMVMIMVLTVLLCTIYQTLRSTVIASMLLVPYLIVMVIVAYANLLILMMNPDLPLWGIF